MVYIPQVCQNDYDKEFVGEFEKFLAKDPNASPPPTDSEDTQGGHFLQYIKVHLQANKCPLPCSRLWLVNIYSQCNVLI